MQIKVIPWITNDSHGVVVKSLKTILWHGMCQQTTMETEVNRL